MSKIIYGIEPKVRKTTTPPLNSLRSLDSAVVHGSCYPVSVKSAIALIYEDGVKDFVTKQNPQKILDLLQTYQELNKNYVYELNSTSRIPVPGTKYHISLRILIKENRRTIKLHMNFWRPGGGAHICNSTSTALCDEESVYLNLIREIEDTYNNAHTDNPV